jgi:alpha-glucoside transport system permease protein
MATMEAEAPAAAAADDRWSARILRVLSKTPLHMLLVFVGLLWLVPTFGLFLTSLLSPADFGSEGWWQVFSEPSKLTWENYDAVIENESIRSALLTTVWVAVGGTILPLFIAVIAMLVVPLQMALIPIFSLYNTLGIFDTILSLILFHTAFGLPFAIFLLRNFFIGIPKDLMEAARIDGASEIRIFVRLILPLGLPAIASLAIFQFLWTWNDLLVALTFGRETQPITVAIFSQLRQFGANIELIAPATFVSLVIPLAVFFAFQRYFVQGLLAGSVK